MLITFSGVDNAGKTTQIALLAKSLRKSGFLVTTFWYRPGYSSELDALRRLVRRVRPGVLPTAAQNAARQQVFSKRGVQAAWLGASLLDMFVQLGLKIRILLRCGHIVLCDRYVVDAILDLELRFPALTLRLPRFERLMRLSVPHPVLQLLLMLPNEEVQRRANLKMEPFPDTPEIQVARYAAYTQLGTSVAFKVIDANRPIDEVQSKIRQLVAERLDHRDWPFRSG